MGERIARRLAVLVVLFSLFHIAAGDFVFNSLENKVGGMGRKRRRTGIQKPPTRHPFRKDLGNKSSGFSFNG